MLLTYLLTYLLMVKWMVSSEDGSVKICTIFLVLKSVADVMRQITIQYNIGIKPGMQSLDSDTWTNYTQAN